MIIGVDVGALSISDDRLKLGVYRVTLNLLRELSRIDTKNTYRLYSFLPITNDFGPRMENRVLRPTQGWFSLRLPAELAIHPVDVFLGLSQAIPVSRARNIGFIYDFGFLPQRKLLHNTTDLVKRSDHIVTISHAVKKDILERFGKKVITVAYPGVDPIFTPIGPKYKNKNPYFLFVGALKRGKNIPFLIRAFAKFQKDSKKPYDLLFVGSDLWRDPNIPRTIRFLGYVPDTQLAELYRGAVAFVSPSLVEGFCLPAVEALACATPVIVSNRGSFPEVVGKNGILVDPLDEDALVRALKHPIKKLGKRFLWSDFAKTVHKLL